MPTNRSHRHNEAGHADAAKVLAVKIDTVKTDAAQSDSTRRKRERRNALQRNSPVAAFLAAIVKSSGDAILGTDLDGKVISANPAVERLTGYSIKEIIGSRVSDVQVPEGWDEAHAMIGRARAEGATLDNCEVTVRSKNGELRELSISLASVYNADGQPIGSAITMRDQTELNATRQKLLQSERLAATGKMISAIAHESRNALQRIQVGVDMLGFELPEGSDSRKDLDRISRAKADLQRLFEDLRNYASPLQLDCSVCSVADVWRHAWCNLEPVRANRHVTLLDKCADLDMDCNVDAFRLEQVFRNLFENTLTACDDPTEITIECREAELEGKPALLIRFCDNGPGLNADQRVRMFDAFFTTKSKGTGLGMAIAKKIMAAHFGTIDVGHVESGGSCFELQLLRSLR